MRPIFALAIVALITGCADAPDGDDPDGGGAGGIGGDFVPPPVVDSGFGAGGSPGAGGMGGGMGGMPGGGAGGMGGVPGAGGTGGDGTGPREPFCDPAEREVCDDFDNNCDGVVDEGCTCQLPEKPCYTGHPADLQGADTACRAGVQACRIEFYGPCEGEVLPTDEVCNGIDDDCDGTADEIEDCDNAPPEAICPPDMEGPPLADYRLNGGYADPDGHPMARATWRVIEQPGGSTAEPDPANALDTTVFADLQGDYVFELTVEDSESGIGTCTTRLTTRTRDGLRIEMVWNVNAQNDTSDVDMHLKRSPVADWFDNGGRGDDCYYSNCKVCDGIDESVCRDQIAEYNADPNRDPPPQVEWTAPLSNDDPRLDLDDVEGNGPENINILTPTDANWRLGVHYYDDDGFGASTVTVKIFCGGELALAFDPVALLPTGGAGDGSTEFWEVADIRWRGAGCEVVPLGTAQCPQICARQVAEFGGGCPEGQTRGEACR